jgi:hypothetical protein
MSAPAAPWIHVVAEPGGVRAFGHTACELGHRLAGAAQGGDGVFVRWAFDGARLVVETDRYGMYPLFAWVGEGTIAVGPSIMALLACGAPRDLDLDALTVFLHVGFFLRDETPFRAIRALPPGARLVWTRAGVEVAGAACVPRPVSLARAAAVDAYVDLLRQAIRRRPPLGRVALPLSGGRDSRHVLFELAAAGAMPEVTVTARHFPWRPNEDAAVALRVASAVRVPHVVLDQGDELAAEIRKNHATELCADEHAWLGVVADFLRGYDTVYDGIAGDVLSAGLFLDAARVEAYERGRYEDVAAAFLQPRSAATLARLVVPALRERLSAAHARTRVAAELATHVEAANPIGAFVFWNRTRREIALAPYRLYPSTLTVYAPYLDHALYDLLAALPARMLLDHGFHTEAITRAFPQYAALAYERGDEWPAARPYDRVFTAALCRSGRLRGAGRGSLLAPGAERRVRWASALDGWRFEDAQLQPRLALYLAELEILAAG